MDGVMVDRRPMMVGPGEGRRYAMGQLQAVFKADCEQTSSRYSVSEWWLEPGTRGPGVHVHDDDHVFYVITGRLRFWLGDAWFEGEAGSYALIPAGTPHDFENRGAATAGFIAFTSPGGFEARMEGIAEALSGEDLRIGA
jgi:quercetin dioxygenase-like cupin family protein